MNKQRIEPYEINETKDYYEVKIMESRLISVYIKVRVI